jgi:hypothetical protein
MGLGFAPNPRDLLESLHGERDRGHLGHLRPFLGRNFLARDSAGVFFAKTWGRCLAARGVEASPPPGGDAVLLNRFRLSAIL